MPFRIVVRGADVKKPPLLDTEDAVAVEVLDSKGELVAIMHKMFDSDYWGVTTKNDDDWEQAKAQLGYSGAPIEIEVSKRKKDFFDI